MAFVESKNIKIYPTAYRGQKEEDSRKNKYNPESAFANEYNISKLYSILGYNSFVISKDYDVQTALNSSNYTNFEFVLGGYYFKIIDGAKVFTANNTEYYAHIRLSNKGRINNDPENAVAKEPTKSTDKETDGYDVNNITVLGISLDNLENNSLSQISNMTSLDNNADYFTGLEIDNSSSNTGYSFTLRLIDNEGKVNYINTLRLYANNIINDYQDFESIKKVFTTDNLKTKLIESIGDSLNITSSKTSVNTNYEFGISNTREDGINSYISLTENGINIQSREAEIHITGKENIFSSTYKTGIHSASGIQLKSDGYLDLKGLTATQLETSQFKLFKDDKNLIYLNDDLQVKVPGAIKLYSGNTISNYKAVIDNDEAYIGNQKRNTGLDIYNQTAQLMGQKILLSSDRIDLGTNQYYNKDINLNTDNNYVNLHLIGKNYDHMSSKYPEADLKISYNLDPADKVGRSLVEIKSGNPQTDIDIYAKRISTDDLSAENFKLKRFYFTDLSSDTPYLQVSNDPNSENLTILGCKYMIQSGLQDNAQYYRKKPDRGYDLTVTGALGPSSLYSFDGLAIHNTNDLIVDLNGVIYLSNSGDVDKNIIYTGTNDSSIEVQFVPINNKLVISSGTARCDTEIYKDENVKSAPIPIVARNGVDYKTSKDIDDSYTNEVILLDSDGKTRGKGYITNADKDLKTNIKEYRYINSILDMTVKSFNWKNDNTYDIGFIAEDLQKLFPELVSRDSKGYLGIAESKLVYLLLIELQKMKKELEELKK